MLTIRANEHRADTCDQLRPYNMQAELTWAVLVVSDQSNILLSARSFLIP